MIVLNNLDGIFADQLSPDEEYRTTHTPLDTVPLLALDATLGITQKDVNTSVRTVCGLR